MALEYEEGFVPQPNFLETHRLKTLERFKPLIGKIVKDIKYPEGYGSILIIFTDGTELDIFAEDCFDFHVDIIP